jgi:hypothetical protein
MTEQIDRRGRSSVPTSWHTRVAILGRGPYAVGPYDEDGGGALAIAPPGVMLASVEENEPATREGWRIARWDCDPDGGLAIDQDPPVAVMQVELADVVDELAQRAPQLLPWLANLVERRLRIEWGRMHAHDHAGRDDLAAPAAFRKFEDLKDEADRAFARAQAYGLPDAPYLRPGWFTDLMDGGYSAAHAGRRLIEAIERGGGPPPPARQSTLRPRFQDDEDDRPRPRPVD